MDTDTEKRLRTLSLFSGIGGIEIGLRRWCKAVCYVELDSYAQAVLTKNMAAGNLDIAPIWDDVRTFGQNELDWIRPIDCVTGGFPCQDISCAGKGAGIHGERSGLFFEIIRIACLARPGIVFLENVPALLVRGMDTVLRELSESGYDARWRVLSAAEVGAPHKRDRVWIICYPTGSGRETWDINGVGKKSAWEIWQIASLPSNVADAETTIGGRANTTDDTGWGNTKVRGRSIGRCGIQHWTVEPDVGRVAHGVPFRVDRLKCLGNAVVPQCAEKAFELLMDNDVSV